MTRLYDHNGNRPGTELMCVPGYPPQSTQADKWDGRLPGHYQNRGNGPTRIGFQGPKPYKPAFRGQLQQALERDELDEIILDGSGLVIGADKRLYEPRQGLIDCLAPVVPKGLPGRVYVNEVDWDLFPPLEELAYLFDKFFSKYTREVLMIVGKRRNGRGWLYHVPKQEGSLGLVTWTATDGEMDWFSRQARWIGTIHIHPGSSCTPSTTDIDDWAAPEKSGLHLIFGRDQDFTINGSIAGRTFELDAGNLKKRKRTPIAWTTSGRLPLNELLLQPKPVRVVKGRGYGQDWTRVGKGRQYQSHMPIHGTPYEAEDEGDFVAWMLSKGPGLRIDQSQLGSMRVVFQKGSYYLMTLSMWLELQEKAKRMSVDLPSAKRLSIYPVKGGRT